MNKIWAFGDSYTYGFACREDCPSYITGEYYNNYKTHTSDIWINLLSNKLDYIPMNCGISGASNELILDSIIENYHLINENDYVIFNKTYNSRMEVPYKKDWIPVFHNFIKNDWWNKTQSSKFDEETTYTIIDFQYKFLKNTLYKKRHDIRFNFIENILSQICKKCIVWDVTDKTFIDSFETIRQHTNGNVNDGHLSFNGHSQLFNFFLNKINNKNII
jgi:hypothetical protein